MTRLCALMVALGGACGAAPVPPERPANVLVAELGAADASVRDAATVALRDRGDARPWLRRAARSADTDTARRAAALLARHDDKRQEAVPKAIDACIRDGRVDLCLEWYHFWKPKEKVELWTVGPRLGESALDTYAKTIAKGRDNLLTEGMASEIHPTLKLTHGYLDGPLAFDATAQVWHARTNRCYFPGYQFVQLSVDGPIYAPDLVAAYFSALGSVHADRIASSVVLCDGPARSFPYIPLGGSLWAGWEGVHNSFVACRGDVGVGSITGSVLLVDGNVDLSHVAQLSHSLIRVSGTVNWPKRRPVPVNCVIEEHVKNPTAPYTFFELRDVGLSVTDDEEGLVVAAVAADTPFGTAGFAKGDLIRAIDGADAGHSEPFRKAVRRALVRQGDCLVTVARGDKTIDLPVFFPPPK